MPQESSSVDELDFVRAIAASSQAATGDRARFANQSVLLGTSWVVRICGPELYIPIRMQRLQVLVNLDDRR